MAISFKKYIDIVSRVGGAAATQTRELIARFYVDNPRMQPGGVMYFTTLESVRDFFGYSTPEYSRARFYFSFVGKQVTTPKKISFVRYQSVASAPKIFGGKVGALSTFTSYAAAKFQLTIDGVANVVECDFTAAASLSDVASILQTEINAFVDDNFANATVVFDAISGGFILTGGVVATTGLIDVSTKAVNPTAEFLAVLGWVITPPSFYTPTLALAVSGAPEKSPAETFSENADNDNNFGSFAFITAITDEQIVEVANENAARNVTFIFSLGCLVTDIAMLGEEINGIEGLCVTLQDGDIPTPPYEFPEILPMAILAATDYNRVDAAQNYMYQTADLTPVILSNTYSDIADAFRINYYGATQQAGKLIAFYQRGYMFGNIGDPLDINIYANEIWIKDNIGVELINLQLALGKISANKQGRATVISGVQVAVDRALANGVISIGKPLTNTQKAYITSVTGQTDAWRQVQNVGYWLDCFIELYAGPGGTPEYKARYVLIYAKDDVIRKIEGSDILI